MDIYKIEILGQEVKEIQRIEEVIQPLKNLKGYFLKLLWIDGESETDEYSVFELQEVIEQQDGILLDYEQLENLCYKMDKLSEILIIGDREEKNLFVNIEDENLYENEMVLELVRDSHWQIITSDYNIIELFKTFFPNSQIVD